MSLSMWGLIAIIVGAVIYRLSPNPTDDSAMIGWAYGSLKSPLIKFFFYAMAVLPPLLCLAGTIIGFVVSWSLGLSYAAISIVLWIVLSPTIRPRT